MGRSLIFLVVALVVLMAQISTALPIANVLIDKTVPSDIASRILQLITESSSAYYNVTTEVIALPLLPSGSVILSFGPTPMTRMVIPEVQVNRLPPEGYIVRAGSISTGPGFVSIFAADGVPPNQKVSDVFPPSMKVPNTGLHYACYALLEQLGFGFFQPLEPFVPVPPNFSDNQFDKTEAPRWPIRGWHYHTEHPLELTNFLNGWGLNSTDDEVGWQSMMSEWKMFLEWLVANRQNAIEFLLLAADEWQSFVDSPTRQQRLQQITSTGYHWGIAIAADIPIAERQQHAWYMIDGTGSMEHQVQQIHDRIDWLVTAGFHFLSTESGFSEFTHPDCSVMVAWMNATAEYMRSQYNRRTFIKAHISTGQMCPGYADPTTGVPPCNFNYLPHYATKDLGVLAHTVQMYSFDDPAPTYGQTNFHNMYEFTLVEMSQRYTLYHGETAYWVNYDIDVPLFLPYYAYGRLYDLRKLARAEAAQGTRLMGQFNFESGWEWAYWLSNTLTARAAWDPKSTSLSDEQALQASLSDITRVFGKAAAPVTQWLMDYIQVQRDLLVLGKVNGTLPSSVVKRNGIAYLEGWDTWAQLMPIVGLGTQPLNLDISAMNTGSGQMFYGENVRLLLDSMSMQFKSALTSLEAIRPLVAPGALSLFQDILDSATMTSMRSDFVFAVYDSMWSVRSADWRKMRLGEAVKVLKSAELVVASREKQYRVPLERVAGWGRNTNPTSYDYGFLWTVHSLFYWYRDLYRSMNTLTSIDPCFLNIIDPARVAFGDGMIAEFERWLAQYLQSHGLASLAECLGAPGTEPHYTVPTIHLLHQPNHPRERPWTGARSILRGLLLHLLFSVSTPSNPFCNYKTTTQSFLPSKDIPS